ncbi:hypothetical protein GCM10011504_38070 [Siccirubricoccus deserti]|uniref:M20/M25/M40 family metallo-hydrolase n=1 Tax=Siccirubricoccus deserti TaxID=2013562 RepID=A0A9X0UDV5_9PROT|nr:M20/M25/M40 family metallo-hydrolase [Siccirubricoccus deserti]MBC4017019.1 M20/M25/M40 family metallo-hydrolase [Siccirubricoccus deserti]GGC56091.1 hypothetical protein GCM10011504_38070 [Siccirubricoccus deserti]
MNPACKARPFTACCGDDAPGRASVAALALLTEHRALWPGEAVLTLAGDEESMGPLGTPWLTDDVPPAVTAAIAAARPISEPLSGAGEAEVSGSVTVDIGRIEGGASANLVPALAWAGADIRLLVGVSCTTAEAALDGREGITWRILRRFEPNHTGLDHETVCHAAAVVAEAQGVPCAVSLRVGGSEARLFRMAGLPAIVYGPTPHNMGGADEYVLAEELAQVSQAQALTALDFLAT